MGSGMGCDAGQPPSNADEPRRLSAAKERSERDRVFMA
jgi:hypothetical protein